MRLTAEEVAAIKAAARETFGETAIVRLFGSRVDDTRRGGDIDLLVEVEPGEATLRHEGRFRHDLFGRIDERKVDLVMHERGSCPGAFLARVFPGSVPL